jgi:hypothetical protein
VKSDPPHAQHRDSIAALCVGFTWVLSLPPMGIGLVAMGRAAGDLRNWEQSLVGAALTGLCGLWLFATGILCGYAGTQLAATDERDGHRALRNLRLGAGAAVGMAAGLLLLCLGLYLQAVTGAGGVATNAIPFLAGAAIVPGLIAARAFLAYRTEYDLTLKRS